MEINNTLVKLSNKFFKLRETKINYSDSDIKGLYKNTDAIYYQIDNIDSFSNSKSQLLILLNIFIQKYTTNDNKFTAFKNRIEKDFTTENITSTQDKNAILNSLKKELENFILFLNAQNPRKKPPISSADTSHLTLDECWQGAYSNAYSFIQSQMVNGLDSFLYRAKNDIIYGLTSNYIKQVFYPDLRKSRIPTFEETMEVHHVNILFNAISPKYNLTEIEDAYARPGDLKDQFITHWPNFIEYIDKNLTLDSVESFFYSIFEIPKNINKASDYSKINSIIDNLLKIDGDTKDTKDSIINIYEENEGYSYKDLTEDEVIKFKNYVFFKIMSDYDFLDTLYEFRDKNFKNLIITNKYIFIYNANKIKVATASDVRSKSKEFFKNINESKHKAYLLGLISYYESMTSLDQNQSQQFIDRGLQTNCRLSPVAGITLENPKTIYIVKSDNRLQERFPDIMLKNINELFILQTTVSIDRLKNVINQATKDYLEWRSDGTLGNFGRLFTHFGSEGRVRAKEFNKNIQEYQGTDLVSFWSMICGKISTFPKNNHSYTSFILNQMRTIPLLNRRLENHNYTDSNNEIVQKRRSLLNKELGRIDITQRLLLRSRVKAFVLADDGDMVTFFQTVGADKKIGGSEFYSKKYELNNGQIGLEIIGQKGLEKLMNIPKNYFNSADFIILIKENYQHYFNNLRKASQTKPAVLINFV